MSLPWFRLYSETLVDEKFVFISHRINVPRMELLGVWVSLLMLANKSPIRGYLMLTDKIPYGLDELSSMLGVERDRLDNIIQSFIDVQMIEVKTVYDPVIEFVPPTLIWSINNWDKRQFTSDVSTVRVKRHREPEGENDETSTKQDLSVSETSNERFRNVDETFQKRPQITDNILQITETDNISQKQEPEPNENVVLVDNLSEKPIFKLYQSKIGLIIPMISEKLLALEKEYPRDWIEHAFDIAINQGKRNIAYIEGILKKWKAQGFESGGSMHSNTKKTDKHDTVDGREKYKEWEK